MHAHTDSSARRVRVQIITVSTSRTQAMDRSGPLLKELLSAAGHPIAGHDLVPDDPAAIGALLDKHLGDPMVEAIILSGGTGISARDCTPKVVGERLDRVLPGFGELFRYLSYEQVGSAAMLSTAVGGVAQGRPIFALPGSPKACSLAMEKLILPELGHLVTELSKETPLAVSARYEDKKVEQAEKPVETPAPEAAPVPQGVHLAPIAAEGGPKPEAELASGWLAGVRALNGTLKRGYVEIPESLEKIAAVADVLNSAGERGELTLGDGRAYLAFGYPDLSRNASKVLILREGELVEIIALHRWPKRVGTCTDASLTPTIHQSAEVVTEAYTDGAYTGNGVLFAVEGATVYIRDGRKVAQWDGKKLSPWLPQNSTLSTLVLHWSQR
jgi:molybdenum cofactor biosynthesis protein B